LPALITGLTGFAPVLGTIAGVIGGALVIALVSLATTLALLNLDKLTALATIFKGLGNIGNISVGVNAIEDVTDSLVGNQATLKPMLGDLALIATGKTTQSVTTSTVGYSLNTFAAKFENTFKPSVTVKIGNEEFKDFVIDTQAKGARD